MKQYFDEYKKVIDEAVDQDVIRSCTEMIHKSTRLTAEEKEKLLLQAQLKSNEFSNSGKTFGKPKKLLKQLLKYAIAINVVTASGQSALLTYINYRATGTLLSPFNLQNLSSKPMTVTKFESDYELQQELHELLQENKQIPPEYHQTITDIITTANKDASFDLEYATKKLSSIKINEVDNIEGPEAYYVEQKGLFNILGNYIVLAKDKTEAVTHELEHAITPTFKDKWAEEAITTYCSNLLYRDNQGYFYTMLAVEMMAEIIGPNAILASNNTGSLEPIKNALYERLQDKGKVEQVLNYIKDTYLNDNSNIYYTIIPDKNYFVNKGNLKLDYNKLQDMMKNNLTNLNYINIFDKLTLNNYYKTDTHWKQEDLFNVANTIANQMNFDITDNNVENTVTTFKGSYAGRLSVTKDIDTIKTISNPSIDNSSVYNYETKKYTKIYDYDKLKSLDKYDIYLSGASSIIDIVNPTSNSNKELIVFRDSYGSSLVPLLIDGYRKITVIDIRYVSSRILNNYIKFDNQDVLFMYSILTINNSFSMR